MKFVDQKMRIFKCISLCEDLVQNRILQEKCISLYICEAFAQNRILQLRERTQRTVICRNKGI